MATKIENTVAILGGAALGALAMFLLDPESGDDRRAAVTDTAAGAAHTTHHAIRDAVDAAVATVHNAYDSAADTVTDTLHGVRAGARKSAHAQTGRVGRYAGVAKKLAGKLAGRVGSAATDLSSTLSDHAAAVADHASHLSDRLSELAGNASDSARDTVSGAADYARSRVNAATRRANSAAGNASDTAAGLAASATAAGSTYADRLRSEILRNLNLASDSATRVGTTAQKNANQLLKDAKKTAQAKADQATGRESHSVATTVGLTTGGIALLAAGAATMYFLDPVRGRARRAQSADQLFAVGRRTGKNARRFGRHVGNQLTGYAAETRGVLRDWQSSVTSDPTPSEAPSMPTARPAV